MSSALIPYLLKLGLTAAIVTVAISYVRVQTIPATILSMQPSSVICACVLLIPNLGLQYLRWRMLLRLVDGRIGPAAVWLSLLAGFPLGLVTPGRWGELGRALFLPAYPRPAIAALTAVDKIMNFAVIILLGGAGVGMLYQAGFLPQFPVKLVLLVVAVLVAAACLSLAPAFTRRLVRCRGVGGAAASWLHLLQRLDAKLIVMLLVLSVLFVATFSVQLVILVAGLHPLQAADGLAAALATFFAQSVLPFSVGDLGIRESAAAFFFSKVGVAPHAAFAAALLLFVINMLLPSLLGLFVIWRNKPVPSP